MAKRGRPTGTGTGARSRQVAIRLSQDEHAAMTATSSRVGMGLTDWLRALARAGAGLPSLAMWEMSGSFPDATVPFTPANPDE